MLSRNAWKVCPFILAVVLGAMAAPAIARQSVEIVGSASVVDGDTIEIRGERIRLEGIDAPESAQTCRRAGQAWRCGQGAAIALANWIGSRTVHCQASGRDRYRRYLAHCTVGGEDMQAWMVAGGHAIAYRHFSREYVPQEDEARASRRGIWASQFVEPWKWRKGVRK